MSGHLLFDGSNRYQYWLFIMDTSCPWTVMCGVDDAHSGVHWRLLHSPPHQRTLNANAEQCSVVHKKSWCFLDLKYSTIDSTEMVWKVCSLLVEFCNYTQGSFSRVEPVRDNSFVWFSFLSSSKATQEEGIQVIFLDWAFAFLHGTLQGFITEDPDRTNSGVSPLQHQQV